MSDARKPGRGRIFDSILDTIGDTPIVRLDKLAESEGVKAKLMGMTLELEEKGRTIGALKDALGTARGETRRAARDAEAEAAARLKAQQGEYEAAIARHLSMIDKLLSDKEALAQKCERLAGAVHEAEAAAARKAGAAQRDLAQRLRRQPDCTQRRGSSCCASCCACARSMPACRKTRSMTSRRNSDTRNLSSG